MNISSPTSLKPPEPKSMPPNKPIVWTFSDALKEIRAIDPLIRERYKCFLALTGGVLVKGDSFKDLDLVLLPMNGDTCPDLEGAKQWLVSQWGELWYSATASFDQKFTPLVFQQYRNKKIDLITYATINSDSTKAN